MTDVSKGVWLGKNQKEVADKIQNLNSDGNLTGDVTSTTIISDNIAALNNLSSSGVFTLNNLPTSDPGLEGYVWNDSGTLKVSLGS